jgi:hypothetical protein
LLHENKSLKLQLNDLVYNYNLCDKRLTECEIKRISAR